MKCLHILFVEDNEGDIFLTTEALSESGIEYSIEIAKDGLAAMEYITSAKDGALPDIIILDVNLPKLNGHQVLKNIKQNDLYKHIPVIMLTTSSSHSDILSCYKNYANCYITKPTNADDFLNVISSIKHFWSAIVQLPKNH